MPGVLEVRMDEEPGASRVSGNPRHGMHYYISELAVTALPGTRPILLVRAWMGIWK